MNNKAIAKQLLVLASKLIQAAEWTVEYEGTPEEAWHSQQGEVSLNIWKTPNSWGWEVGSPNSPDPAKGHSSGLEQAKADAEAAIVWLSRSPTKF